MPWRHGKKNKPPKDNLKKEQNWHNQHREWMIQDCKLPVIVTITFKYGTEISGFVLKREERFRKNNLNNQKNWFYYNGILWRVFSHKVWEIISNNLQQDVESKNFYHYRIYFFSQKQPPQPQKNHFFFIATMTKNSFVWVCTFIFVFFIHFDVEPISCYFLSWYVT